MTGTTTRAAAQAEGLVRRYGSGPAAVTALDGAVAAAAGILLGIGLAHGLAALLATFGLALSMSALALPAAGLAASWAAGLTITVAAAVPPTWRATRVASVQHCATPFAELLPAIGPARRAARMNMLAAITTEQVPCLGEDNKGKTQ
jgi:putative ABC transport system permease protein